MSSEDKEQKTSWEAFLDEAKREDCNLSSLVIQYVDDDEDHIEDLERLVNHAGYTEPPVRYQPVQCINYVRGLMDYNPLTQITWEDLLDPSLKEIGPCLG